MREVEVPEWLKRLPLAPEFRPTDSEFSDPIAYISKIEKEAGAFGICKVIPPLPKPSKKYVLHNLNKSLFNCPDLVSEVNLVSSSGGGESKGLFTTRQQELGQSEKRVKGRAVSQTIGAPKQVWQSGEVYTLEQFELKSKNFAKCKLGGVKDVSPVVTEAMFWKASTEKPVYVEYANDVPGSGFGELEGSSRYLHGRRRHRRKRGTFIRNNVDSNGSKNGQVSRSSSSVHCNNSLDNNPDVHNTEASIMCSISSPSDLSEKHTGKKCSDTGNEMEGTAGWKLTNSPWNLQVIARSPGSLTRFMPDDIPGVTSPMIYIGMLFSWFAWHVEDHELHSLNYLHVGSPKTWYAVPGDYASTFEEAIRLHAYGGNVSRLDALTQLGEKTTLLSPEVIITSGIPCCRLVQNPGEFVVTFPRAYHLGFSHGFNCGEAANFGTPLWLEVAKEAAVRRAAMNYLPMLSHQQLLYLLTMSFVSRVPRSLLLGVRNSRLRNRQKEERESSVKKAFVEDLLKENCSLSTLLQNSSCRVVMWDLDRLPSSSKVSRLHNNDTISPLSKDANPSDNSSTQDLYTEMNLFMDNVSDLYADDDDDLLSDYQVDSGTLPCVGCGILGFPFMAVVQPSEQAAQALLAEDPEVIQKLGAPKSVDELSSVSSVMDEGFGDGARKSKEEILCHKSVASSSAVWGEFLHPPEHASLPSPVKPEEWKPLDWCLRPRIFCLEHAVQTVDMLLARGGSKVLGICHSDFTKIIAHAAAVAEDIHIPFTYNEIPLEDASPEDLSLIDHAIGGEEKDECTMDWTARLHISMQHCAKMRKADPYHKVQHALNVGGLFYEELGRKNDFKWQSRRLRSIRKSDISSSGKSVENVRIRTVDGPHAVQDGETDGKGERVILQCYRRKSKSGCSATKGILNKSTGSDMMFPECPQADCGDLRKNAIELLENACVLAEDPGIPFPQLCLAPSVSTAILQDEDLVSENLSNNSALQTKVLPTVSTSVAESNEILTGYVAKTILPEMNLISGSPSRDLQKLAEVEVSEESCCTPDIVDSDTSASLLDDSTYCSMNFEAPKENITAGVIHRKISAHNGVETDDCGAPSQILAEDVKKDVSSPFNLCSDANDLSGESQDNDTDDGNTTDEQGVSGSEILSSQENTELNGAEVTVDEQGVSGSESLSSQENTELNNDVSPKTQPKSTAITRRKRKRELDVHDEDQHGLSSFIRGPCEGLRPRSKTYAPGISNAGEEESPVKNVTVARRKPKKEQHVSVPSKDKVKKVQKKGCHKCDVDGCRMSFHTKDELAIHKRNRCPVEGCGKKFSSHKYAIVHQRVHNDDRPLKCTWEGCKMNFKWAWARTEHLRVHTGERPYKCQVEGCGLTFRFVSDFSRHRRKTGHYAN